MVVKEQYILMVSLTRSALEKDVFFNVPVRSKNVLWVSLTGDALEKDNFFSVPEQCINSHSRTMRYEDFINRRCIKKRCFCGVPEWCTNGRSGTKYFGAFEKKVFLALLNNV